MNRRAFIVASGAALLGFAPDASFARTVAAAAPLSSENGAFDAMIERFCRECSARNPRGVGAGSNPAARFASYVPSGLGRDRRGSLGRARAYLGRLRSIDRARLSGDRKADFDLVESALLDSLDARQRLGREVLGSRSRSRRRPSTTVPGGKRALLGH